MQWMQNDISLPHDGDDFPFGKYGPTGTEPCVYGDVPASYLNWLRSQDWLKTRWPAVWKYIDANEAVIDFELEEEKTE